MFKKDFLGFTIDDSGSISVKIGNNEKSADLESFIAQTVIDNQIESLTDLPCLEVYQDESDISPSVSVNVATDFDVTFINVSEIDQPETTQKSTVQNTIKAIGKVEKMKETEPKKYEAKKSSGKVPSLSMLKQVRSDQAIKTAKIKAKKLR